MIIWRKITRIKILFLVIKLIRYMAGTNIFNIILDFIERYVLHTSYKEDQDFFEEHADRVENIINIFSDERSKSIYKKVWMYRITHKRMYLKKIVDRKQYFDKDLIKFIDNEFYVDCGAYKGDTILKFIKYNNNNNFKIVAFEPDPYNFKILESTVKRNHAKNKIKVYNLGTWSYKKKLKFLSNTEEACKITANGDSEIDVDTIDNIVGDNKVTFIKMDVEGAEMNSLLGACETIEKYHPRLAISIYHSNEDMINIAEYLHKHYPFYNLYVRHYSYFYGDTVLYAIGE